MRYIFLGGQESQFAQIILNGLKKSGWQPLAEIRDAKKPLDIAYLKSLKADFFLVAAFGKILKKEIIEIPLRGVIGVHPSLLPRLRGASPIQTAILNDEKETGITLFLIDEKVDHGPIIANSKSQIANSDNYETLLKKLAELSVDLAIKTVPKWLSGNIQPQIQNESEATNTKKFTAKDALIDLKKDDPKEIWLKIRALNPEPGVYTNWKLRNGQLFRLKLLEADFGPIFKKVQPEGKKPMAWKEFLNGYPEVV